MTGMVVESESLMFVLKLIKHHWSSRIFLNYRCSFSVYSLRADHGSSVVSLRRIPRFHRAQARMDPKETTREMSHASFHRGTKHISYTTIEQFANGNSIQFNSIQFNLIALFQTQQ